MKDMQRYWNQRNLANVMVGRLDDTALEALFDEALSELMIRGHIDIVHRLTRRMQEEDLSQLIEDAQIARLERALAE